MDQTLVWDAGCACFLDDNLTARLGWRGLHNSHGPVHVKYIVLAENSPRAALQAVPKLTLAQWKV